MTNLKMTTIFKPIFHPEQNLKKRCDTLNNSPIYTILKTSGKTPAIEYSSCNRVNYSVQMTERYTYEQKTTYRRPPTRGNTGCPT